MRTTLIAVAALLAGLAIGWGIHRNRTDEEIWHFRSLVGMSDEQISELYQTGQATMEKMEFDQGMTALFSLEALNRMHHQNEASARELLAKQVASYYAVYGPTGNPDKKMSDSRLAILKKIDAVKDEIPELQKAIEKALADINTTSSP